MSKSASPRRVRPRVNSSGTVQHQITLFDYVARAQQAGTISSTGSLATRLSQPSSATSEHAQGEPLPAVEGEQNVQSDVQLLQQTGEVDPLAQQIEHINLHDRQPEQAAMEVDQGAGRVQQERREVGDKVDLVEWIDPVIPGPRQGPAEEDSDGWSLVDSWNVWDCTLCQFPTMQDIPRPYRETWAAALERILREINMAEGGIELERGLKWLLIIPKAVFRQSKRGGEGW